MIDLLPYLFAFAALTAVITELIHRSFTEIWLLPASAAGTAVILMGLPEWLAVLVFFSAYAVFLLSGRFLIRILYTVKRKQ